ncbi:MAG TPA: ribosomal protein S18-alanine N-acetyltransferase [Povalibacter sp.]|nr:ribosomal protein S18-alanine N-acetyltransferase [Povalibacter sp.]
MSAELDRAVSLREVRFRPMTIPDVGSVAAVERASYQFPWSEGVFRDCVRVGYLCRVIEYRNEISGYGIMSFGAGEAHVLNICVQQQLRGSGVGRRLMEYLLDRARDEYMQDVFLEVRPSNAVAIRLYESMGFERIGQRKGYYQAVGGREDALVYKLALEPKSSTPGV